MNETTRSLILALGVCYHACLQNRKEYREFMTNYFVGPCEIEGPDDIGNEIAWYVFPAIICILMCIMILLDTAIM